MRAAVRARLWPQAMITLTTHDTKRGEDVRARIGVLSQVPALWTELTGRWAIATPCPTQSTALFLLQNIFGVWPADGVVTDELRERLHALRREGDPGSRRPHHWNDPDDEFEAAVHAWLDDGHRRTGRPPS